MPLLQHPGDGQAWRPIRRRPPLRDSRILRLSGSANAAFTSVNSAALNKPAREFTGNSLLCEDVLVDSGVTDLSVYDCIPGSQLGEDFWVEGVNPPGYAGP